MAEEIEVDKSKLISEFGVSFNWEGGAILDSDMYTLVFNVSLDNLQWQVNPDQEINLSDRCDKGHIDLQMVCAQTNEVLVKYAMEHNIFVEEANNLILHDIKPQLPKEVKINPLQKVQVLRDNSNWQQIREDYGHHIQDILDGKIDNPSGLNLEEWNWMYQNQTPGNRNPESYWTNVVLQNLTGIAQRYEAGRDKHLDLNWTLPELQELDEEYFKLWPTMKFTHKEKRMLRGLSIDRISRAITAFRRKNDLARDAYKEMENALRRYMNPPQPGSTLKQLDISAINAAGKTQQFREHWTHLKTRLIDIYNLHTRTVARELEPVAIMLKNQETNVRTVSFANWVDSINEFWSEADMTKSPSQQRKQLARYEWNGQQLAPVRRAKRQVVAGTIIATALVTQLAGMITSQIEMRKLRKKLENVQQVQAESAHVLKVMQGEFVTLAETNLQTARKLQNRIDGNRRVMKRIATAITQMHNWENQVKAEEAHMHEAFTYLTNVVGGLSVGITHEATLRNAYLRELFELRNSLVKLKGGSLTTYLVNPATLKAACEQVKANLDPMYQLIIEDPLTLYQLPAQFKWERDHLLISLQVPVKLLNAPVHDIYKVNTAQLHYNENQKENEQLFTELKVKRPFVAMGPNSFVEISQSELDSCLKLGKLFLCDVPMMQVETADETCLSALYNELNLDIIRKIATLKSRQKQEDQR